MWAQLGRDRIVQAGVFATLALALPYALPLLPADGLYDYGLHVLEPLMLAAVLLAALFRQGQAAPAERRFWRLISLGYLCYFLILLPTDAMMPADWRPGRILAEEALNLLYYAAILIALAGRPHESPARGTARLATAGSVLFCVSLLIYFVLIPSAMRRGSIEESAPALLVYLTLEVVLFLTLMHARHAATNAAWRWTYSLLAIGSATWIGLNALEAIMLYGFIPYYDPGHPVDLLWLLPHVWFIAATRAPALAESQRADRAAHRAPAEPTLVRGSGVLLACLAGIAVIHFVVEATGLLDPRDRQARDAVTMITVIALGALALADQRRAANANRALAEELGRSQKMEALGRLAGGMAHDFNNLMTVIHGHAGILRDTLPPEDRRLESIDAIERAGDRATNLTRQLLALGRRTPANLASTNLNDVVDGVVDLMRSAIPENIAVRKLLDPNLWPVMADPPRLEQVLLNLAMNARDAMPAGGELVFTTRNLAADEAQARGDGESRVVLEVRDTGAGMDEATLTRAFEPFFTTKHPGAGSGLGLAIAYGIVQQHAGDLDASSRPGRGTVMRISLPRAQGAIAEPSRELEPARTLDGTELVVVVEDQPPVLDVARRVLESRGYRVRTATSVEEALLLVTQHPDCSLVLTDIIMPGRSGLDLARVLRERAASPRMLFMTGYAGVEPEGAPVLRKPFTAAALAHAVRSVIDA